MDFQSSGKVHRKKITKFEKPTKSPEANQNLQNLRRVIIIIGFIWKSFTNEPWQEFVEQFRFSLGTGNEKVLSVSAIGREKYFLWLGLACYPKRRILIWKNLKKLSINFKFFHLGWYFEILSLESFATRSNGSRRWNFLLWIHNSTEKMKLAYLSSWTKKSEKFPLLRLKIDFRWMSSNCISSFFMLLILRKQKMSLQLTSS